MNWLPQVKTVKRTLVPHWPTTPFTSPHLVIVILEEGTQQAHLAKLVPHPVLRESIEKLLSWGDFTGKWLQTSWGQCSMGPNEFTKILLLGCGNKKKDWAETCRHLGVHIASEVKSLKHWPQSLIVGSEFVLNDPTGLYQFFIGLSLGVYEYQKSFITKNSDSTVSPVPPWECTVVTPQKLNEDELDIVCRAQVRARLLQDGPPNTVTPSYISQWAKEWSRPVSHMSCKVFSAQELKALGMNAILAVGGGSSYPPEMVVLEYAPPSAERSIAFVGKGLTFDTGGYSLKTPSDLQSGMKYDMSGAALSLASVLAMAELKLPVRAIAVTPLCENMVDALSYRVDDVIQGYSGKTIEVLNTDAEGRIVLSDALSYTADKLNPDAIIEFSTLTGAIIIALGHLAAGVFPFFTQKLQGWVESAAQNSGERIWTMPTYSEVFDDMKSAVADMSNIATTKGAGSIQGAVFLKEFVNEKPFLHIDIAGVANGCTAPGFPKKQSSGYGVQLALGLAKRLAQEPKGTPL